MTKPIPLLLKKYATADEAQALGRLLEVALSNTGQSELVANFLLAWWNTRECGGFAPNDLWGLDQSLRVDILTVLGLISRHQIYPDTLGLAEEFHELVKRWRATLIPPPVWRTADLKDHRLYPARLVTYSSSPGYRDIGMTLSIIDDEKKEHQLEIRLQQGDAEALMHHVYDANRTAWSNGRPIDANENEPRPYWIDRLR